MSPSIIFFFDSVTDVHFVKLYIKKAPWVSIWKLYTCNLNLKKQTEIEKLLLENHKTVWKNS